MVDCDSFLSSIVPEFWGRCQVHVWSPKRLDESGFECVLAYHVVSIS